MIDRGFIARGRSTMQIRGGWIGLAMGALAALANGCGGESAGSPTAPPVPVTPSPTLTLWNLTDRFVSVTGPDNCWVREQRERLTGLVFTHQRLQIDGLDPAITLENMDNPPRYAGTVHDNQISASGGPLEGGGRPCQDGTSFQQLAGVSELSGRFSADRMQLTATVANIYRLADTGEEVSYTWDWSAVPRN